MKKAMDILLFCGQSNMQGSTGEKGKSRAENCWEYKYLTDAFTVVQDPVGEDIGEDTFRAPVDGCGSLVPAFCKAYAKRGGVVAIHCAKGATAIHEWQPDTPRYTMLIEKCKKGILSTQKKFGVGKVYFIWLQGESDALMNKTESDYLSALVALKNALKQDLGIDKFGIIKVGYFAEYATWTPNANKTDDEKIMRAQERAAKEDSDFLLLTDICARFSCSDKYLNPKEHGPHYNNRALDIIGKKAGKRLARLITK